MSNANPFEMMAAQELPGPEADDAAPDWVHLLPAGEVETFDARGPYLVADPQAVIEASMSARGDLEIDENHASFLAAPKGGEAPARGWITEMQSREGGIWGKVNWTPEGHALVASKAYRRLSPVIDYAVVNGRKIVTRIRNASLVNRQNLRGLTALNQEQGTDMDFMAKLAAALGLGEGADEAAILDAIKALAAKGDEGATEMQAAVEEIGVALGLEAGADAAAVLKAAKATGEGEQTIAALQAEVVELGGKVKDLTETGAKAVATAFVDGAIKAGHVGVKPMRDRYIAMHMEDPAGTEELIGAMPCLGNSGQIVPTPPEGGEIALNAEQIAAAKQLGIPQDDYLATLKAERANTEAL